MRTALSLFFLVSLSACQSPVDIPTPTKKVETPAPSTPAPSTLATTQVSVMNSLWQVVKQDQLARTITSTSAIQSDIDAYNATHTDDQWFLVNGDIPGIDQAPPCKIYIVDAVTHVVLIDASGNNFQHDAWPRRQLVENYSGWLKDAQNANGVLYIDVIPPPPIIIPPTAEQIYATNSIYVLDSLGVIKFEEHCSLSFVQVNFPAWTLKDYFQSRLKAWQWEALYNAIGPNTPWTCISGSVYTAP